MKKVLLWTAAIISLGLLALSVVELLWLLGQSGSPHPVYSPGQLGSDVMEWGFFVALLTITTVMSAWKLWTLRKGNGSNVLHHE